MPTLPKMLRALFIALSLPSLAAFATPIRVDLNANDRADMRTPGWQNWIPSPDDTTRTYGDVKVSLRGLEGPIRLSGKKSLVVDGVTVGADGVVASRAIEIAIEGLTPGWHSFVGYHHAVEGGADQSFLVSAGGLATGELKPMAEVRHNDEVRSSFLKFKVESHQPVLIEVRSLSAGQVWLNGFALDLSDPDRKALKPVPADGERHADGDAGRVELSWSPSRSAVLHHVYFASGRSRHEAERKLAAANTRDAFVKSTDDSACSVAVPADSLRRPLCDQPLAARACRPS